MRNSRIRRVRMLACVCAMMALSSACDDTFFAAPRESSVAISYDLSTAVADNDSAYAKTNHVRIRVTGASNADTLLGFAPGTDTRVRLTLDVRESNAAHQVEVTLLSDTLPVFRGTRTLQLRPGQNDTVGVMVEPVIGTWTVVGSDLNIAIGDSVRVFPRFRTGDTIARSSFVYQTSDPSIATINSLGWLRGVSSGSFSVAARGLAPGAPLLGFSLPMKSCPAGTMTGTQFSLWSGPGRFQPRPPNFTAAAFNNVMVLFGAGLIYGTNANDLMVGLDVRGQIPEPFYRNGPVCVTQVAGGTHTRSQLRITKSPAPTLSVLQETWTTGAGWVLVRYTFRNFTATNPVNGLRVGLSMDWDLDFIGSASDDRTRFDSALGATQAFESTGQMAGVAGVGATQIVSYTGGGGGPANDPQNAADYLARIDPSSGISTVTAGPADIRQYVGFTPIDVAPQQSVTVMFVFAGGNNAAEYAANVTAARAAAATFPVVQ